MANDRIWMICKYCEEAQLLYKYYPNGNGYLWEPDEINDFLNKHISECRKAKHHLAGEIGIEFVTESETGEASGQLVEEIVKQISVAARDDTESAETQV